MTAFIDDPDNWQGWSLGQAGARLVLDALNKRRPSYILEAGSGSSTVVLAEYASRQDHPPTLVSLEHLPLYRDRTVGLLNARGLVPLVDDLALVSLVNILDWGTPPRTHRWYDVSRLPEGEIDFVLVDGPPGHVSGGRIGALTTLWPTLADDFELWLDDAHRAREIRTLREWKARFGIKVELFDAGSKRMARVTR